MTNLFNLSIVAILALLSQRFTKHRISSIICIISVVFTIYIQSIGSGMCNDGGLFQVTTNTIYDSIYFHPIGWGLYNDLGLFQVTSFKLIHSLALLPLTNKASSKASTKNPLFKWNNLSIPISKGIFLNKQVLNTHINQFWMENIENISKDLHLLILTRIKFDNGKYQTISSG